MSGSSEHSEAHCGARVALAFFGVVMKNFLAAFASVLACLAGFLVLLSCGAAQNMQSHIAWGHFKELDNNGGAAASLKNAFFFQLEKGQEVRACIPGPLPAKVDSLWLQAELTAAINAWGRSVGRFVPMNFVACSANPQLILLFQKPPTNQAFVGYTEFGRGAVPGARTVYLNPSYDWELTADTQRWRASPEINNAPWKKRVSFLLRLVLEGNLQPQQFPRTNNDLARSKEPTFAVLLHELGHGWGMCDMYEDNTDNDGFHSNCSTAHRGSPATEDEIMGQASRPGKARFKLSAADIAGLQALLSRSDVPAPASYGRLPSSFSPTSIDSYMKAVDAWAQ